MTSVASSARTDVGPSVKILLVQRLIGPAVPCEEYTGAFELETTAGFAGDRE